MENKVIYQSSMCETPKDIQNSIEYHKGRKYTLWQAQEIQRDLIMRARTGDINWYWVNSETKQPVVFSY